MKKLNLLCICIVLIQQAFCQSYVLDFNGTTQYVNLGTSVANGARTMEFWFKPDLAINSNISAPGYSLLMRDDAQVNEFGFYIKGTDWPLSNRGYLCFYLRYSGVTHEIKSDASTWTAGSWYHVCGVLDPVSGMKLYLNGQQQINVDATATNPIPSSPELTALGKWGAANLRYFDGKMDEVKFWTRALNTDEIKSNMCACINTQNQEGLRAYWKFDGSVSPSTDVSGNNYVASVNAGWISENLFAANTIIDCPKKNEFKIGLMDGFSYLKDIATGYNVTTPLFSGQYTSQLNILKKDGINIVHSYSFEYDEINLKKELDLIKANGMAYMGSFKDYYNPTQQTSVNTTYMLTSPQGENIYDNSMGPGAPLGWKDPYPHFDNVINQVYVLPQYKDVVWGVQSNEEAAYGHIVRIKGSPYCPYDDNHSKTGELVFAPSQPTPSFYKTEIPRSNVLAARSYFKNSFATNNLDVKLISMEAGHGTKLTSERDDPEANGHPWIKPSSFLDFMNPTDKRDVFFEGSYVKFPYEDGVHEGESDDPEKSFDSWDKTKLDDPEGWHYLNKLESINLADDYANEVHAVTSIGAKGDLKEMACLHTRPKDLKNYDWMWFQAYSAIVHGVKGIWIYNLKGSYDPSSEQWKINALDSAAPGQSVFTENYFSDIYNNGARHLVREIAYLKNNGYLTLDNKPVIFSNTDETYDAGIINAFVPTGTPNLPFTGNGSRNVTAFYNAHKDNSHFQPQYTIRSNGQDVILIITNPMPIAMLYTLDFSCLNNEIIAGSTGLDQLFSNETWPNNTTYKLNRDGQINLQQNTIGIQKYLPYTSGKSLNVYMGPVDAMVFKFRKGTNSAYAGTNNGWDKVWSNHGDNKIGDWLIRANDKFYPLDFDGDGKKNELLCVQTEGQWISVLQFNGSVWNTRWSNYGNNHGLVPYRGELYIGDFNGDGRDDILGNGAQNGGWTTLFTFYNNDWQWSWSDNGNSSHPIRAYRNYFYPLDVDGDGKDELLGVDYLMPGDYSGGIKLFRFLNNDFTEISSQSVYSTTEALADLVTSAKRVVGDFDSDGMDEIWTLGSLATPARLLKYENGFFRVKQTTSGNINGWALPVSVSDKAVSVNREAVFISQPGYLATHNLLPNYSGWNTFWYATSNAPYLDDFYLPGNGSNAWDQYNDAFEFDFNLTNGSGSSPRGLLVIRKNCLGLVNIYAPLKPVFKPALTEICLSTVTGSNLQVNTVPNADYYIWTYSGGWTGPATTTAPTATVMYNNIAQAGYITCKAHFPSGATSSPASLYMITTQPPSALTGITYAFSGNYICPATVINFTALPSSSLPGLRYHWIHTRSTTVVTDISIESPYYSEDCGVPGNHTWSVSRTNACGTSNTLSAAVYCYSLTSGQCSDGTMRKEDDENTISANKITIIPNPNDGQFKLVLPAEEKEYDTKEDNNSIFIYNALGMLVYAKTEVPSGTVLSINLENMNKGIYLVRVEKNKTVKTVRFIIQ